MPNSANQQHLDYKERVNLGSYYTGGQYVDIVWRMLRPHLKSDSIVLDSSCGYGGFLRGDMPYRQIGGDIDQAAVAVASGKSAGGGNNNNGQQGSLAFFTADALRGVSRSKYGIKESDHLCIIGNPPYNDRTSLVRNHIKQGGGATMDEDIMTRDLGMSFILSYQKLRADVVCVLHPLSYLIKQANFNALKRFAANYKLASGMVISSGVFKEASKSMRFPILIGLYVKSATGMSHQDIMDFRFCLASDGSCAADGSVASDNGFVLSAFDDISNSVRKYPDKSRQPKDGDIFFWTLRDINALKRNRTFVQQHGPNTIVVDRQQLDYYIYIDVFKQFARHVPYYFGNCDVLLNDSLFLKYRDHFILECLSRHNSLRPYYYGFDWQDANAVIRAEDQIRQYMQRLLGVHYVH